MGNGYLETDWSQVAKDMMAEWDSIDDQEAKEREKRWQQLNLSKMIFEARLEKKLTQSQLAERTGLTREVITRLESGKGNPTYSTLTKVASALDCKLAYVKK